MEKQLVFEIGTEELPARYIPNLLNQLKENATKVLTENRISFDNIRVYGTPRRLALLIDGISDVQEDSELIIKGPPKRIAIDENGNFTKAALGFAKSQNIDVESLVIDKIDDVEYLFAHKKIAGRPTLNVLRELLPQLITSLNLPKSMRWGDSDLKFLRPIRWILALLDEEVVEFVLDSLKSDRITYGHRFLGEGKITLRKASEYLSFLKELGYVILDPEERKKLILEQSKELAESVGGKIVYDEKLIEEIVYITEYPTAFIGKFDREFIVLPKEVIITPMKEHQRYIPIIDHEGNIMPYFIGIRNGNDYSMNIVINGNERVLRARLSDANFFYREDLKHPLEYYVHKLKDIVFLEELGTLYDKIKRLEELSDFMGGILLDSPKDIEILKRASYLSKADLATQMVYEFPELQGIMGRYYALLSSEDELIADAIYEHYLPRHSDDELPRTLIGAILSIIDKMDTIVGCFGIDIQPTGSQDPYGLRRQAIGIVNIIFERELHFSLSELISNAISCYEYKSNFKKDREELKTEVINFFKQRIRNILIDKGYRYDIIDAVLDTNIDDIADIKKRMDVLAELISDEDFNKVMTAFTRANNLSQKAITAEIKEELLEAKEEKILYKALMEIKEEVYSLIRCRDYKGALMKIKDLYEPINTFFENVMVMVEDNNIRMNRLALLKSISDLIRNIANLSLIVNKPL